MTPKTNVPGNWELQGFGTPYYLDEEYPFTPNPPYFDSLDNPVGSYKRAFTIPNHWKNQQVFIHFASVRSAFYLWINGKKVGRVGDAADAGAMTAGSGNVSAG